MDTVWFQQALARIGASQADLARHLRLPASAISRMLNGQRGMKPLEIIQTAAFLGLGAEEIVQHAGDGSAATPPLPRGRPPGLARGGGGHSQGGDAPGESMPAPEGRADLMPIRSAGRGGVEQEMFLEDGPIGYTQRPANLDGVRDAYAIYMVGDSMAPRYEPGWLLHVNPFKAPTRGRDVVVYKRGQAVLIKQFVGWQGDALIVRQFNPPQTLRIPRTEVLECHLVVGVDQEG
jgi:hypothetical protein